MEKTSPFKLVLENWLYLWEDLRDLSSIWNWEIFNDTLDVIEKFGFITALKDVLNIGDITIPVDITIGNLLLGGGFGLICGLAIAVFLLKFLDLIIFWS